MKVVLQEYIMFLFTEVLDEISNSGLDILFHNDKIKKKIII